MMVRGGVFKLRIFMYFVCYCPRERERDGERKKGMHKDAFLGYIDR